jgi:hypothetical protein
VLPLVSVCSAWLHQGFCRFLDKGDRKSTGNLLKHAKSCWGVETVKKARSMNADEVREGITQLVDGSITAHFKRKGKGKITYSH